MRRIRLPHVELCGRWQPAALVTSDIILLKLMLGAAALIRAEDYIHGTADRLTVPPASKVFVDQVSGDVTLIEYEGLYHEPHNEPEQEQVFEDVLTWLESKLAA